MVKGKNPSVEQILAQLDAIVEALDENIPIEESLARFEEGIKLVKMAQKRLQDAEQRVQMLVEKNGEPEVTDYQSTGEPQ